MYKRRAYQKTDGTFVDPILDGLGDPHGYSGTNLAPFADLSWAYLPGASLDWADLSSANLSNAWLHEADLRDANLYSVDLSWATFSTGTILYDGQTVLQHGFDAAGLQAYLEASPISASHASNLNLVPEPASVFLLLGGLLSLGWVRFQVGKYTHQQHAQQGKKCGARFGNRCCAVPGG